MEINVSPAQVNQEFANVGTGTNVRYTMQLRKSFNYNGDVLASKSVTANFTLSADTPDINNIELPWGLKNIPWLASNGFQFQSYTLNPNYDANIASYVTWTESYVMYSDVDETDEQFYEITEEVTMPTWNLKFFYMNNPNIGTNLTQLTTDQRIRQVFGLKPITGRISAKSLVEISHDPYQFISKNFSGFNGVITDASIQEGKEEDIDTWQLNISWTSGDVATNDVPSYNLSGGVV